MTQKSTTKTAQDHTAPVPTSGDLADMPIAQLLAAVQQASASLATIRALLANPTRLTTEERKHAIRLKNGESAVLEQVADVAADPAFAPLVASLADLDFGVDPAHFEPALLKERLQRIDVLAPLAQEMESFAQDLGDTVMELTDLGAPPLRQAYAIFKSVSKTNATLRGRIASVIDFYAAIAQAAVKSRKAHKAAAHPTAPGGKA